MRKWGRGVAVGRKSQVLKKKNKNRLERKLRQLHDIIPGAGKGAAGQVEDTDAFFQRIAAYILFLESRVELLKSVYALFHPHD
ncbi:hypothetical protein R6Q59_021143 [Mikania micrantha]